MIDSPPLGRTALLLALQPFINGIGGNAPYDIRAVNRINCDNGNDSAVIDPLSACGNDAAWLTA